MARRTTATALLACALSLGALSFGASAAEPFAWPDGKRAAVSLGYDDALDSQLDIAIPALDRHGFKGTFYLVLANPPVRERMADWRAAARIGHELGNHTLFHQCSGSQPDRGWVEPQRDLDTTTAAQMADQIAVASTMLDAIDGKGTRRTLALPCGESQAKDSDYVPLVKAGLVGIRVGGGAVTPDMATLDPAAVTVDAPVGLSGKQLIAMVKQARKRGTMATFTFHGVGGDYLTTSAQAHEELLAYLDANRDIYWVATFREIMDYIGQRRPQPAMPATGR